MIDAREQRNKILRDVAEREFTDALRTHGWATKVEGDGDELTIIAERGGHTHKVALLYSSATDNSIYRKLAQSVEHIYLSGGAYMLESFAFGIDKPVGPSSEFYGHLLKWNEASAEGKFAPIDDSKAHVGTKRPSYRMLLSEEPIQAIWLRLRQLQSVVLARKLIEARAEEEGITLSQAVIQQKAEGVAYALRNSNDYFNARDTRNVSQRVLNLYYGSLAFASAEMLAAPRGSSALSEIEKSTTQGHGLYTVDGAADGIENLVVGVISSGFFPTWLRVIQPSAPNFPAQKARKYADLAAQPQSSWLTIEQLFASIPEISDLFFDIFDSAPRWVRAVYDTTSNQGFVGMRAAKEGGRVYILLVDESARLNKEDIANFSGPISEIVAVPSSSGRVFRAGVDQLGADNWRSALKMHGSPFKQDTLIKPIFGAINEYRALTVTLLYALSIIVRYRPSIWRRVQEGDLDHMRALIEAYLAVVERVLPEQFLETITGHPLSAKQPGSFF